MRKKIFEWIKRKFGKRHHISTWLSNLSVGTVIVGAFQHIEGFQFLGENAQTLILGMAAAEFVISLYLAKEE